MTSQSSAYPRFRRALATGNLTIIRAAAAELPYIELTDALRICVLLRDDPPTFERAALRWIARFCLERPDASLGDVQHAVEAFGRMKLAPDGAAAELHRLVRN